MLRVGVKRFGGPRTDSANKGMTLSKSFPLSGPQSFSHSSNKWGLTAPRSSVSLWYGRNEMMSVKHIANCKHYGTILIGVYHCNTAFPVSSQPFQHSCQS